MPVNPNLQDIRGTQEPIDACAQSLPARNPDYDRVRTRRRRLEVLARPLCRSNSDAAEIQNLAGAFDLLLAMVKVPLDLPAFINALAPNGRMHFVGVKFVPIIGE